MSLFLQYSIFAKWNSIFLFCFPIPLIIARFPIKISLRRETRFFKWHLSFNSSDQAPHQNGWRQTRPFTQTLIDNLFMKNHCIIYVFIL